MSINQNLNDLNIIISFGWMLYHLNLGPDGRGTDSWDKLMTERNNLKYRSNDDS